MEIAAPTDAEGEAAMLRRRRCAAPPVAPGEIRTPDQVRRRFETNVRSSACEHLVRSQQYKSMILAGYERNSQN
jgi:hypothetical protein